MIIKRLFTYLKPYKKQLILVGLIVAISTTLTILTPKLIGNFISSLSLSIINKETLNIKYLTINLTTLALFYLINTISSFIETYFTNNISEKIITKLKNEANEKLSKLPQNYYDTHKKGEIISIINNDTQAISALFTQTIPKTINYLITFIGVLVIMFTINITISLITLIALPLITLFSKYIIKISRKKYTQYYTKNGQLNSIIEETYQNQQIISLYNNEKQLSSTFSLINKELSKTALKASLITTLISPINSLINYLIYLIVIFLGSSYVLNGKLLIGDIYSLIQYTKQLGAPINGFSSLTASIQNSLIAAQRIFAIIDQPEQTHSGTQALETINSIEFKNVSFSYNTSLVLKNINFSIKKGEKVAIVGETGSGKSTIINLLMQFYKINQGEILINNKNIYSYDLTNYYNNISLLPQEISLFTDTIENNLKFANSSTTKQQLINNCQTTNSLNFINKLPNKFQEIIKEEKQLLSQGEKQLLTITRAITKNYNLLILDEATSNIDSQNEKNIQNFIENLPSDKTAIIIAHRLSTILKADKIIVLKNGEITEIGNHHQLYNQKGEYYKFFQSL